MSPVDPAPSAAPLIVGVGASAGGLEAILALTHALPADAPLGVVVVQHLGTSQPSNLAELIARQAPMTVKAATDGQLVEAGHIYVMTPTSDLRIESGRLYLVKRATAVPHLPIDAFFISLAQDRGRAAAGVVLSGTGADGSEGVRALRRVGASTFAQDQSAQHSGMPEAAFATECIDQVLSPEDIAAHLVERAEDGAAEGQPDEDALQQVFSMLRRTSGIDFSTYKPSTLRRRIQRRAALGRHATIEAYVDSLRDNASELDALSEDMLIHVTAFFRDPAVFEALSRVVIPPMLAAKKAGEPLRVWVPGCSTGEEVYSLVIALSEQLSELGREVPLKIFGTDLSEKAIERARVGLYPPSIEGQVNKGRLQRFFEHTEVGYQVRKDVRDACVFARQDITRDPPFSNIDIVSCRNLMIYLSATAQRRVVPLFHYALRPGGVLLLGASESPGTHPGFEVIDGNRRLYRRTARASSPELVFADYPRWPSTPLAPRPHPAPLGPLDVQREADRAVLAAYAPPGVVVTDALEVVQFRGHSGPFLEPAPGTATLDVLRLAREDLRIDLRAALERARQSGTTARSPPRVLTGSGAERVVEIEVIPLLPPLLTERHFVVLFREQPRAAIEGEVRPEQVASPPAAEGVSKDALRQELSSTRAYLQSVIEQLEAGNEELRAANEEVVSSNEELQSTNEELQTAKEELQATNEELTIINSEMAQRNTEGSRLNDDLSNVLTSVGIAILILGRDLRIRRFTPAAARLLNLIASDAGRPISDIKTNLRAPDLLTMVNDVLEHLTPREQVVADEAGRWYQLTARPYLTSDRRVDGAVVSIVDIDALEKGKALLTEARDYAEGIVDTVREPLLVLDAQRCVRSANRSFYETFGVTREQVEGQRLDTLGQPRWVVPEFSAMLDRLGSNNGEGRFEDVFTQFGGRAMRVSGRPLNRRDQRWLLLAFEDLTEQMKQSEALRRSEKALRDMLSAASEAIIIADQAGRITYVNTMAAQTFGYALEEMKGLSVDTLVPDGRREMHPRDRASFHAEPRSRPMGHERELQGRRKDGTVFPAEVGLSTMEGEEGPLVVAFVTDITPRKESEARISVYRENLRQMAFDAAVAEERQRRRLALDLHDNVGQTLALAQLRLKTVPAPPVGATDLSEGIKLIAKALNDTRELTFELSPPVLYDLGLPAAVAWLGEQLESQHQLHVEVDADAPFAKLDDEVAGLLFRAVRELLTNVVTHAQVTQASVSLRRDDGHLVVGVEDKGTGFDPARASEAERGFGLFSVREQITRLGGTFEAQSNPGQGTRITLSVPLHAPGKT